LGQICRLDAFEDFSDAGAHQAPYAGDAPAGEIGSQRTPRWREMDSNHQYLEDKRRFVQRLRLCRVFDESLATATFFTPLGIIARNLSGR